MSGSDKAQSRARWLGAAAALAAMLAGTAADAQRAQTDPDNPTCPRNPNWSTNRRMTFTLMERPGQRPVLLAEGVIDDDLIPRLTAALQNFQGDEIWLRSPGGNAEIGNQAGRLIRSQNFQTRIPEGWACFSACNFLFMGGTVRTVDPGGLFIVHMFTYTADRQAGGPACCPRLCTASPSPRARGAARSAAALPRRRSASIMSPHGGWTADRGQSLSRAAARSRVPWRMKVTVPIRG
jgi:hypothetical protein